MGINQYRTDGNKPISYHDGNKPISYHDGNKPISYRDGNKPISPNPSYVVTLACEGGKAATIKYHLAVLRQAHIRAGLDPPEWSKMARLAQTRRGLGRWEAVNGTGKLERHPVKWCHMKAMKATWESMEERGNMLWAAACLCFFGCLRAGEALAPPSKENLMKVPISPGRTWRWAPGRRRT